MLVPGARDVAATPAGTDEAEDRMVVGEGRNMSGSAPPYAGPERGGWNEPPSTAADAGQIAALNQAPDRCTRYAERPASFVDGDHLGSHTHKHIRIISSSQAYHRRCRYRLMVFRPRVVMETLGHSQVSLTLNIYPG